MYISFFVQFFFLEIHFPWVPSVSPEFFRASKTWTQVSFLLFFSIRTMTFYFFSYILHFCPLNRRFISGGCYVFLLLIFLTALQVLLVLTTCTRKALNLMWSNQQQRRILIPQNMLQVISCRQLHLPGTRTLTLSVETYTSNLTAGV